MSLDEGAMRDDSSEPITMEWAKSLKPSKLVGLDVWFMPNSDRAIRVSSGGAVAYRGCILTDVNTRGRFRHLLQAFGIEVPNG